MPRVPTYDNFQVAPNALPQPRLTVADASQGVGDQSMQLGQAMQGAGNQLHRVALDMQQQLNQVRVDAALNQVKEESLRLTFDQEKGYTNIKGNDALQRPDNKPLDMEYGDTLQERVAGIAGSLGNEAQRAAFLQNAQGIVTNLRGNVMQHMASESRDYQMSVAEGIQATAAREIVLRHNEPEAVEAATMRIGAQVYQQAKLLGKSAEWQEAQTRKVVSGAHGAAIAQAIQDGRIDSAQAYFKRHGERMDADDWVKANSSIQTVTSTQMGQAAAQGVIGQIYQSTNPSEIDRMIAVKQQIESNGKQFNDDGSVVTSSAGAIGIAQVMPATGPEAAKLAGLAWDPERFKSDAKYNAAIGRAYFVQKLKETGGDVSKAYAAYNAGLGGLQKGEAAAKAWNEKNPGNPRDWLSFMPAETQGYVAKATRLLGAGAGAPPRMSLFEAQTQAMRNNPALASNPVARKAAEEAIEKNYKLIEQDRKDKSDEAYAQAMQWGAANGHRVSEMPVALKSQIAPEDMPKLLGDFKKMADGDGVTDKLAYVKYMGDDAALKKLSEAGLYRLRSNFDEGDFKSLVQQWSKANGKDTGSQAQNKAGDLPRTYVAEQLYPRLMQIGIETQPGKDEGKKQTLANIVYTVDKLLLEKQAQAGKQFNDAERSAALDDIFNKRVKLSGGDGESVPLFRMGPGKPFWEKDSSLGKINSKTLKSIKASYARSGVAEPTEQQIMHSYWLGKAKGEL